MRYVITHSGKELEVEVNLRDDGLYDVGVEGRTVSADLRSAGGHSLFSLLMDSQAYEVSVARAEDQVRLALRGHGVTLRVESEQQRNARLVEGSGESKGPHTVKSLMPGRVARLLVREGEEVSAGTPLLILEAMKMENEVRSRATGVVSRILVSVGQAVRNDEPLVTIT